MTAQRSMAEVYRLDARASAIMEYNRPITLERTFNALRDAIRRAEAEIDKYKRQVRE